MISYIHGVTTGSIEEGSPVQMELYGPSKFTKLTCLNGRWSNGPPMLHQFGPSKRQMVQWTAYVTSIWTVQMDSSPMDRPCYVNLDGPSDHVYYANLDHPKLRLWSIILYHIFLILIFFLHHLSYSTIYPTSRDVGTAE